jgi:serine protease Do
MKKLITGGVAVMALLVVWLAAAPRPAAAQGVDPFTLSGAGSSVGVTVRDVTPDDASKAKLAQPVGAYVESVRTGSPAEKAGIRTADIILDFDGERIRSVRQFTRLVQESAPRRSVPVVVVRGTERQTLQVVPELSDRLMPEVFSRVGPDLRLLPRDRDARPRDFNFNVIPDMLRRRIPLDGPALGVSVTPVTGQLADYFGVTSGVLVSSVGENTAASDAGIKAGDVITAIDGRAVTSAADIADAMRRARAGESVDVNVTRDRKSLMLKVTPVQPASGRSGLPV